MVGILFKKIPWGVLPATLFLISLCVTACTQGQGPSGETPDKVTVAGTETPAAPVDVCEKSENLDNVLCQWVATELNEKIQKMKMSYAYDSQGRMIQMESFDQEGNRTALVTLIYNDYGLWKLTNFSDPTPPDSQNYTKETNKTYTYDSQTGLIQSVKVEAKTNGQLTEVRHSAYTASQSPQLGIWTDIKDGVATLIGFVLEVITKDPASGKILTVDKKTDSTGPFTLGGPMDEWEIWVYEYDAETGRIKRMTQQIQDCVQTTCNFSGSITAAGTSIVDFFYDPQDRIVKTSQSAVGIPSPPLESEFTYGLQTQGKIIGPHPLEFFFSTFAPAGFKLNLNDRDIFSTWTSKSGGQALMEAEFKWARLWEVLPEGKPPGN